jgi:hypothetical protein
MGNSTYPQMPYTEITPHEYEEAKYNLFKIDMTPIYEGQSLDAIGESYCSTDSCEVKEVALNNA